MSSASCKALDEEKTFLDQYKVEKVYNSLVVLTSILFVNIDSK